jgi:ATP-dependent helicase/nuclease subunit A
MNETPSKATTSPLDLSPEQQRVVNEWGRGMSVMAGAGSGKTTTLVIKCAELLKRNPKARFCAVSFTEKSASDLKEKLARHLGSENESSSEVLSGHWVMTIHGLCAAILREYPREAGFDGEESMLSEGESQRLWERAIEQLWSDQTPEEIEESLERLLNRESRASLQELLRRCRDLYSVGILESLRAREDADSKALAVLSEFVVERYDRLKRRRGALDFNDLERGADRALEFPEVRQAFQKRFDLVLVDEFQDTNPLQARIILRFVKQDLSNLCVVGDPKQSIYRFRDADVSVFEDFCNRLAARFSLTWNFRSRPGIIHFTNEVCSRAFEASETMPMKYEALEPKRQASSEFAPVARLNVKTPSDLAAFIRSEMERGVPLEDMALLLRKIRGNEKWLRALSSAGIPIAVGSGGLFWEDPRVRELVSFLKWWANPQNTFSGAVFFRAPWVGVADGELDRWFEADPTGVLSFFSEKHLGSACTSGALARALEPYRGKVVRPAELLLLLLVNNEVEDEIGSPLLGLWHRAEELSSSGLGFQDTVAELATAMEETRREREVAPPRNQGQLPVLTFHGAKGLEFKHVILVDLGQKQKRRGAPLLYWDREKGAFLAAKDEMGERAKKDPLEEEWKSREQEKELAESKRVFYVALTRAQERLILVCSDLFDRKGEPIEFHPEEVYQQDFWRGWIECQKSEMPDAMPQLVKTSEKIPKQVTEQLALRPLVIPLDEASKFPPKRPRHSVTEWNLLSRCERAYEWTYVRPRLTAEDVAKKKSEFLKSGGGTVDESGEFSQRELGTRVHACLELRDFDGLLNLEAEAGSERFKAAQVIEWAEKSPYMNDFEKSWSELPFELAIGEEILVGSMDRVLLNQLKNDQARAVVVDFKVTRKGKSSAELLDAYSTQMELYRFALSRLLESDGEPKQIDAVIVNFSQEGVEEVRVESAEKGEKTAGRLASLSSQIIGGKEGVAQPQSLCRVCQFRPICPEGQTARQNFD